MSKKQTDPKPIEDGDPTVEEISELHNSLEVEKVMKRIDVLEDMLDIMTEQ
jgi:hypothetical protein